MSKPKGTIVLMGSGELTATMVEVHKEVLASLADQPRPVFLDTPAGFQLNVDQLSHKAVDYFQDHVQQSMSIASFKSNETTAAYEAEQAFRTLREGNYILIGPGSPTYAVRQWQQTPVPKIFTDRVESGGCLVAASAAALTVGRFSLPVYEIYKVGEALHWVEGLNILGAFGFDLVVIPHWNNAEGGTHDTRFCYMGEERFSALESLLPDDVSVFGLDEHTACIINLQKDEAMIKGIGRATLRRRGAETAFKKGDRFSLEVLRGGDIGEERKPPAPEVSKNHVEPDSGKASFWDHVHAIEKAFAVGIEKDDPGEATNTLLELDRTIWKAQQDLESEEFVSQAREILREMIVSLGVTFASRPKSEAQCLAPVLNELLKLRQEFRRKKQWQEADAIRDVLAQANVIIEDTKDGPQWRLKKETS
jgi:peptidase E